jgi:hypothetical protein
LLSQRLQKPPFAGRLFSLRLHANKKVFNTTVDKTVEKYGSIFVSDSARNGSALCTAASAGTFVSQAAIAAIERENCNSIQF